MADLSELQNSGSTKMVGASTTGAEVEYINSFNAQMQTVDILNGTVVQSSLTVGVTATECKVGASILANRKMLIIQPQNSGYMFGFSAALQPFSVANAATLFLSVGPNVSIWIKKASGSSTVSIAEVS